MSSLLRKVSQNTSRSICWVASFCFWIQWLANRKPGSCNEHSIQIVRRPCSICERWRVLGKQDEVQVSYVVFKSMVVYYLQSFSSFDFLSTQTISCTGYLAFLSCTLHSVLCWVLSFLISFVAWQAWKAFEGNLEPSLRVCGIGWGEMWGDFPILLSSGIFEPGKPLHLYSLMNQVRLFGS